MSDVVDVDEAIALIGEMEAKFWLAYHMVLIQDQRIADLEEVLAELGFVLE